MKRFMFPALAFFVATSLAIAVTSGPEVGEGVVPFNVRDITGPSQGKTLCYRCQYGAKPVACVFTREITPEVAALIQQIDATAQGNDKLCAFVVLLTDDADAGAKQLTKLAAEKKITKTPLTVYDGVAGPEKYKIAKDAAVTVLLWNKSKVQASHAFAAGKLTADDVKAVTADTSKILN